MSLTGGVSCPGGYRPVIVMHGILDKPESMDQMVAFIQDAHPGTDVYNVDAFNDLVSHIMSHIYILEV